MDPFENRPDLPPPTTPRGDKSPAESSSPARSRTPPPRVERQRSPPYAEDELSQLTLTSAAVRCARDLPDDLDDLRRKVEALRLRKIPIGQEDPELARKEALLAESRELQNLRLGNEQLRTQIGRLER